MKTLLRRLWFALLGKDPEPVVVVYACAEQARALLPGYRHIAIPPGGFTSTGSAWLALRRRLARMRIAMAVVRLDGSPEARALALIAPLRVLAVNARNETHHLKLSTCIASLLFLRGVPLDRIWLRPWRRGDTVMDSAWRHASGRGFRPGRPRVAIVSPYLPWPLAHGGAVRIWNLIAAAAGEFDIVFFGFEDGQTGADLARAGTLCAQVAVAHQPRYRQPRWSTLRPPEVCEFYSPALDADLRHLLAQWHVPLLQAEYTQMAAYRPDILVEHDVTFDLAAQVYARTPSLSAWWDHFRWLRYERRAVAHARAVVAMAAKDRAALNVPHCRVIANGVDLNRFRPTPEPAARRVLFIGSFRHHPNVLAYRFLAGQVWPLLPPDIELEVVAGPRPELYHPTPPPLPNIRLHGFVADVVPLYERANLVVAPTLVSAGTNLKVLEAMAMQRAILSTPSGCAGLGLEHAHSVWIEREAPAFAQAILRLLDDPELRRCLAANARQLAVERYAWPALGWAQRSLWRELHPHALRLRPMTPADAPAVEAFQSQAPAGAQWQPRDYLDLTATIAELDGHPAGFIVSRAVAGETEIINLVVDAARRGQGIAKTLLDSVLNAARGDVFLEVRESNQAARALYASAGFQTTGRRPGYYHSPPEDAVVMGWKKC